ncbi:response regulator transcription factor [Brockia lithotrophica]|uniref:response regulator transcription factor n=1 Tax=Brockia lithotrophica TaxID=933949 RepID=UPI003EBB785A
MLLVEDEPNVASFVAWELEHAGYTVTVAEDGLRGLGFLLRESFDLAIVDWMLPELDGLSLAEAIRRHERLRDLPILFLTARDAVADRVRGLRAGADDYLVKPFHVEELLARVEALLRRSRRSAGKSSAEPDASSVASADDAANASSERGGPEILVHGRIRVDVPGVRVTVGGRPVELTAREFDLLVLFLRNRGRVLSREEILDAVWGTDRFVEPNIVDVYVRYLRQKLDEPGKPSFLETVRGKGYVVRERDVGE